MKDLRLYSGRIAIGLHSVKFTGIKPLAVDRLLLYNILKLLIIYSDLPITLSGTNFAAGVSVLTLMVRDLKRHFLCEFEAVASEAIITDCPSRGLQFQHLFHYPIFYPLEMISRTYEAADKTQGGR